PLSTDLQITPLEVTHPVNDDESKKQQKGNMTKDDTRPSKTDTISKQVDHSQSTSATPIFIDLTASPPAAPEFISKTNQKDQNIPAQRQACDINSSSQNTSHKRKRGLNSGSRDIVSGLGTLIIDDKQKSSEHVKNFGNLEKNDEFSSTSNQSDDNDEMSTDEFFIRSSKKKKDVKGKGVVSDEKSEHVEHNNKESSWNKQLNHPNFQKILSKYANDTRIFQAGEFEHSVPSMYDVVYSHYAEFNKKKVSLSTIEWGDISLREGASSDTSKKYMLYSAVKLINKNYPTCLGIMDCVLFSKDDEKIRNKNLQIMNKLKFTKRNKNRQCGNVHFIKCIPHHDSEFIQQARCISFMWCLMHASYLFHNVHLKIYEWSIKTKNDTLAEETQPSSRKFVVDNSNNDNIGPSLSVDKNHRLIVNGALTGYLVVWDLSGFGPYRSSTVFCPQFTTKVVEDPATEKILAVDFNTITNEICCITSGGDIKIWDYRNNNVQKAHNVAITSCHWNPHDKHYFLTADEDGNIKYWDSRSMRSLIGLLQADRSLKTFKKHDKRVNKVMWSPHSSDTFASCSDDTYRSPVDTFGYCLNGTYFNVLYVVVKLSDFSSTRVADIAWHPDDAFSNTIASVSTSLVTFNDNNKIKPSLVQGLLIGVSYSGALQLEPKPDWNKYRVLLELSTPSWLG
ncbi:2076_t:CDS:10, partial [Gigaspora margarita]